MHNIDLEISRYLYMDEWYASCNKNATSYNRTE